MKRFIIACAVIFALAACLLSAVFSGELYLPSEHATDPDVAFRAAGDHIEVKRDGRFEKIELRGVDVSSSIPGHAPTEFAVDAGTWRRWFGQLLDMGANCLRTRRVEAPSFYAALRAFNEGREHPLYLLQGITVDDYDQNSHVDAFDDAFLGALEDHARLAVDAVHGARFLQVGRVEGSGSYTADVSPWTLGYLIGDEWVPNTIVYTDKARTDRAGFAGVYLATAPGATPFESMLARAGDALVTYETSRFGEQRPVAFSCDSATDPLAWPVGVRDVYGMSASVDTEAVVATEAARAGVFTCYQVGNAGCDALLSCSDDELRELGVDEAGITEVRADGSLGVYLRLLDAHHAHPVVAGRVGAPSTRLLDHALAAGDECGGMSEAAQAEMLVQNLEAARDAGLAGAFIHEWQDDWAARSWNTLASVDVLKAQRWSDAQTTGQGYGLLAFDPGGKPVCVVDGEVGEWEGAPAVAATGGIEVGAAYDERYLYLAARGAGVSREVPLYLALDVTPKSGATAWDARDLSFDAGVDFIVQLAGAEDSHVLVQERYEVERVTTLREMLGEDPYMHAPEPDAPTFTTIDVPRRRAVLPEHVETLRKTGGMDAEALSDLRFDMVETGRLVVGDADPASPAYDSRADIAYGTDAVEVRIPWGLINFLNPAQMQVHDDYYEHYGVDGIVIDSIGVGIARGGESEPVELGVFDVEGWGGDVAYRERLKPAYHAVRAFWEGDAS